MINNLSLSTFGFVTLLLSTIMSATSYSVKQKLRKQIRTSLSSLSPQDLAEQSAFVWEKLFQLPEYQTSKSVGLFLSMPKGEIRTDEACRKVLSDGKQLFVPRVGLDFEQCDMDLIRVPHSDSNDGSKMFYEHWPRNKWGIPEAPISEDYATAQLGDIDLLVVPGLGFDSKGGRLGQGKGYYDRFISKMRKGGDSKPLLVAVGLEPSLREEGIPMMDHDFRMDMVILPNKCLIVDEE